MCGIVALLGDGFTVAQMDHMLTLMAHRGPDGDGQWADPGAGLQLGHVRLSIIDVDGGAQPMTSPDERYALTFNGEIYNYLELRGDLEASGWRFRTSSDTEVLLAGLALEGPEFLVKTIGMFALALWDRETRALLLARDRMGIKPLYIAETATGLAAASEMKSLLALPGVSRDIDPDALEAWLTLRYVPAPQTMLKGIRKFPAGHYAWVRGGEMEMTRWWDIEFESPSGPVTPEQAEQLDWYLSDAVRLCMRSDVGYGVFLSGGVDSSLVAGLMAQHSAEPVRTYSIGFAGSLDEREDARAVAAALGTQHTECELRPEDLRRLPDVVRSIDEPFPDPIVLAMDQLAALAAKDQKVALTGEGADELFAGYVHHPHLARLDRWSRHVPQPLLDVAGKLAGLTPVALTDRLFDYPVPPGKSARDRVGELIRNARTPSLRYLTFVSMFGKRDIESLLEHDASPPANWRQALAALDRDTATTRPIDRLWQYEHRAWLADNILFKQDKSLMAHSIEGRVPFCDHRLVELVARLPLSARLGGRTSKPALRAAACRLVPRLPPASRKKTFMIPLDGAYGATIREMAGDLVTFDRLRDLGPFRPEALKQLLARFTASQFIEGKQVQALLMLTLWQDAVRDNAVPVADYAP